MKAQKTFKRKKTTIMNTELQALQNAADVIGLTVHEKTTNDKRQTVKRYFAQQGTETVSPCLDYEQLNYFLLGWIKCISKLPK